MIDVDYQALDAEIDDGSFRTRLQVELVRGFRTLIESGERLPPASYYAAKIAEIISNGAPAPLEPELAFHLYQEILAACENASSTVLGEKPS